MGSHPERRTYLPAHERKRQIISVAQEVFCRSSLHGTSTRDIAKAAQINPATLFEHFESKEALFHEAVVLPLIEAMRGMQSRVKFYENVGTSAEQQRIAGASVERQIGLMAKLFPLFASALFSDLDFGRKLYVEYIVPLLQERSRSVSGLIKETADPYFVELATLGVLFAIAMDETLRGGALDVPELANQFMLLFAGLAKDSHQTSGGRSSAANHLRKLRPLGRSDLRVAPLCLSTPHEDVENIFNRYVELGGNFIDTAGQTGAGLGESLPARLIRDLRQHLVISSSYVVSSPRSGLSRTRFQPEHMTRSVEDSLQRLGIDCIDLLYLHEWDDRIPVDEVLRTCDDLVRAGKIRHLALSDLPAWQASRLHAIAALRGWPPFVAVRAPYNLTRRAAEYDLLPMARELGMSLTPHSPLARATPSVAAAVNAVAQELERTAAQVSLAWTLLDPTVISPLITPRTVGEVEEYVAALDINFKSDQIERLESVSRANTPPRE